MPAAPQGVTIEPNGQSVVVVLTEQGGGSPIVYANRHGTATVSMPATITTRTTLFLVDPTAYTVSCKVGGLENANGAGGTATIDLSGGGVATVGVGVPVETDTIAKGTYAQLTRVAFRAGRKWLFGGDSITNGSAASNFAFSYTRQSLHMVGTQYAAPDSIEAGTAGYTSTQLLAQMPSLLATYAPDAVHLQIGTNDAGQTVPLATFQANIAALVLLCKKAGCAVTIGTVPPRSASVATATTRALSGAYNFWLRTWAPGQGLEVAEVYAALVDTTTGDMLAAYDSGDGVHPNTLGHGKVAQAVSRAMLRTLPTARPALVTSVSPNNYLTNPLMVSAGTDPTGSFAGVATGTAPTRSMVADTSGFLLAGQWAQIDLTAAAASAFGRDSAVQAGWSPGDTVFMLGQAQVVDVSGGGAWEAAVAAGTASVSLTLVNGSSGLAIGQALERTPGLLASGVYNIGPILMPVLIPAGVTSMTYRYQVNAPSGLHVQARFGALAIVDATVLGLAAGGSTMINVDGP